MAYYRKKTYIAGAWDEDYDAIQQLYYWNKNDIFLLEFSNIHDFVHSKDSSLACSIKQSLSKRMDRCKYFVLIVGPKTNIVTKGKCMYCGHYNSTSTYCDSLKSQSNKSFVEFECDNAVRDNLKVLVLYNASYIYKKWCPESLRNIGIHIEMKTDGKWDYKKVLRGFLMLENN